MANLYIKTLLTREIIKTIDVGKQNQRQVEKVMRGIPRNLNVDEFYVDDSEIK